MNAYRTLARNSESQSFITNEGWLKVFSSDKEFASAALDQELMRRAGVNFKVLERDAVLELEPNLNPAACKHSLYQPESGFVRFPSGLASNFFDSALQRGAKRFQENVKGVSPKTEGGIVVWSESGEQHFDKLVIAAGAWSAELAKQMGDKISMDAERGYHVSFGKESASLMHGPVAFPASGLALSPMHDGVRLLNGTELAGLKARPNYKRIRSLIPKAQMILPALKDLTHQSEWIGFRPSTPDSLPVIGCSPNCEDVLYAFGHGHLGLTLAAITAQMIAAEIAGRPDLVDKAPYSADRF